MHEINVLQINADNFGKGGTAQIIWRLSEKLWDKGVNTSYLILNKDVDDTYVEKIKDHGGHCCWFSLESKGIKKLVDKYKGCTKALTNDAYDVVHINVDNAFGAMPYYIAARKHHVRRIMVHAHTTRFNGKNGVWAKKIVHDICRNYMSNKITKIACSKEAGEFFFGKKADVNILLNGLDYCDYAYNRDERRTYREKYSVNDKKVIIHVGKFSYAKNHEFIIKVFYGFIKQYHNSELWLVGDRDVSEYNKALELIEKYGLSNDVRIWGNSKEVRQLMAASDVMIFPSRYEGFGMAVVEAQVNGLPILCSDVITDDAIFNENVTKLSLKDDLDIWINKLSEYAKLDRSGSDIKRFRQSGLDISESAQKLYKVYRA